jgi:hypothetical protein
MEAVTAAAAWVGLKAGTIIIAALMAALGFMLDSRKHSLGTAALAIIAGTAIAVLMTDPLVDYLHLSASWGNAVAGLLGISGRNLVMVVNRVSRNPGELMRIWRGERDE